MDIRRTILLMIFSFSLLLLWNNWQVHQGSASMFGPTTASNKQAGTADTKPSDQAAGVPSAAPSAATPAQASVPSSAAANQKSELVTISTDVLRLTFDEMGAQLVRADLLAYPSTNDRAQPTVLLERGAGRTYIVQTGVVGAPAGQQFPTHLTAFKRLAWLVHQQGSSSPLT